MKLVVSIIIFDVRTTTMSIRILWASNQDKTKVGFIIWVAGVLMAIGGEWELQQY